MDDSIREARHHGLTGDPGDEQQLCPATMDTYGGAITLKCCLFAGHSGDHSSGGSMRWEEAQCDYRLAPGEFNYQCDKPAGHTGAHGGVYDQGDGGRWHWSSDPETNRAWIGEERALMVAFGRPAPPETPEWLEDNLPATCYTPDECLKRIRAGGPASCRRQPACSS